MRVIHHSIVLERKCCFDVEKFGFHRLISIISLFIFSLVLSGIYNIFCVSSDTFAHTTSITSSGAVTIDVSASGNQANLGTDNITVNSSCPLGYTVSIAGPADNTLYRNGDSTSSDTISASTGTTSNPVSILGNNLGTWGYSTANNTTISSNFIGLTNTQTLIKSSVGASSSGGDSFSVYYGVSVTNNTASGIYTLSESSQGAGDDAIVYYLTPNVNCASYIIRYNDNGANSNTTMGITHSVIEDDEVTLAASNYKRNGYGFAGWSTVQLNPDSNSFQTDLATAKAAGKVFGPNETITANAALLAQATVENNTQYITMYAIWVKPATNAYLQNWQGCNSMNTGEVIALTDQRDSQAYAVAKLVDDNCWMIENLRLDYDANFSESLSQGFGKSTTYGNFIGLAQPEIANFADNTTANSIYYSGTQSGTASINIGTTDNPDYRMPRYNNNNTNSNSTINPNTTVANMMTPQNANIYSYGNYYTWSAALANTIYYDSPTATDTDGKTSETVNTSLCPAGWKLPRGGSKSREASNDFWALVVTGINGGTNPANYNSGAQPYYTGDPEGKNASKAIRTYPNNFLYSGNARISSLNDRGNGGFYWTSTTYGNQNPYDLYLGNSDVFPGTDISSKYLGYPIRCLMAKDYLVAFNANGGSGTMANQTINAGTATNLSSNTFTAPTGSSFAGWNTASDGSGTSYSNGQSVTDITAAGKTITLYAMWSSCSAGSICYDDNGANSSTTMGNQSVASNATSVNLWPSNYQRANYGFAGWNTAANGSGTNYGPNETIDNATVLNTIQSSGLKLYAMWVAPAKDSSNNDLTFQTADLLNVTLSDNETLADKSVGYVTALKDARDNQVYAIAKLADGNYWMIENLRVEAATTAGSTNQALSQGYAGAFSGLATAETANFSESTTANSKYSTSNITGNNQGYRFPRYNNGNTNSAVSNMTTTDANIYSYGNYYSFAAALANTSDFTTTTSSDTANTSICPAGWRLPRGGDRYVIASTNTNDIYKLWLAVIGSAPAQYNLTTTPIWTDNSNTEGTDASKAIRAYPNNYIYSGAIDNNAIGYRGSIGYFWTSTTKSGTNGYHSGVNSSAVIGGTWDTTKALGLPIRCIANVATSRKTLYEEVEDQSRGTQTAANLQAALNASNSGVYEYNSTAFGADTDRAKSDNTKATIYYYRGILDNTTGTYGSNGDGVAYPNYVILDGDGTKTTADTCWRIIRTTGSGGVKMIYNGNWTGSTCANATTSAQISSPVATSTFNGTANTNSIARQAVRVGYTHNSTYATTTNSTQSPDTLFGSNSNYSVNNTNSTIKGNVESWYNSNLTSYTSILEPNAGYCNDRSAFQNTSGSTATSTLRSYVTNTGQSGATYRAYFGAYTRNIGTSRVPGLGCSKSTVDVYSTSTSAGGNGQLAAPVALITADEASFAGSGSQTASQGSGYNANSFLRTGSNFWTMSPYYRYGSYAYNFYMNTNGYMQNGRVDAAYGIRPVVSLQDGTTPSDGTGTATDPWVIMAP